MNKTLIIILVLLVVIFGGYFLLKGDSAEAPIQENDGTTLGMPAPGSDLNVPEMIVDPNGEVKETEGDNVVSYTSAGYSPSTLTIKKGQTVTWKNNSQDGMWTASSMHPTHKDYPTTGGCLGSTFDACTSTQPGQEWSFKFDIAGEWKYHNHVVNGKYGTIVVVE